MSRHDDHLRIETLRDRFVLLPAKSDSIPSSSDRFPRIVGRFGPRIASESPPSLATHDGS